MQSQLTRGLKRRLMYVENKGVEPDVTVENPPNASFQGGDAQLDAAVKLLLDELAKEPVKPL